MQVLSFLAGAVSEGVRSLGSLGARTGGSDGTNFDAVLDQVIQGERAAAQGTAPEAPVGEADSGEGVDAGAAAKAGSDESRVDEPKVELAASGTADSAEGASETVESAAATAAESAEPLSNAAETSTSEAPQAPSPVGPEAAPSESAYTRRNSYDAIDQMRFHRTAEASQPSQRTAAAAPAREREVAIDLSTDRATTDVAARESSAPSITGATSRPESSSQQGPLPGMTIAAAAFRAAQTVQGTLSAGPTPAPSAGAPPSPSSDVTPAPATAAPRGPSEAFADLSALRAELMGGEAQDSGSSAEASTPTSAANPGFDPEVTGPIQGVLAPTQGDAFRIQGVSAPGQGESSPVQGVPAPGASVPDPGPLGMMSAFNSTPIHESNVESAFSVVAPAASRSIATDPTTPDRSVDRIDPELRDRLDRVVERMAAEHGHSVELVEGFRTPERQAWLYEQGRTRSGDVVTWTRTSNHSVGQAVDVRVDGSWNNPTAFARLQRIAREEGLATLGMSDPGHLELPGADRVRGEMMARGDLKAVPAPTPPFSSVGDLKRADPAVTKDVARAQVPTPTSGMARVAQVASVADVASIAQVATPGSTGAPVSEAPAPRIPAGEQPQTGTSARPASGTINTVNPEVGTPAPRSAVGQAKTLETPRPIPAPPSPFGPPGARAESPPVPAAPAAPSASPSTYGFGPIQGVPAPSSSIGGSASAPRAESTTHALSGADAPMVRTDAEQRGGTSQQDSNASDSEAGIDAKALLDAKLSEARARRTESGPRFNLNSAMPAGIRPDGSIGNTEAIRASSTIERLNQVMALQDAQSASGGWRLTMPDADGEGTRLRLGLAGSNVSAQVDLSDPVAAARMQSRMGELAEALEARGLTADQFVFRAGGAAEALEAVSASTRGGQTGADLVRAFMGDLIGDSSQREQRRAPNQNNERFDFGRDRNSHRDEQQEEQQ